MELKLKIYKNGEVEKEYTTDTYDLMFGTIEDIVSLLDGVVNEEGEIATNFEADKFIGIVTNGMGMLKPFLKEIFTGVTDEEIRRTKVKELVPLFLDTFKFAFNEIAGAAGKKLKKK